MDSESLIMAERDHHQKDTNIAQKIHSECDRQFNNADDAVVIADSAEHVVERMTNGNADKQVEDDAVISNGNGIQQDDGGEEQHSKDADDFKDDFVDSLNVNVPVDAKQQRSHQVDRIQSEENHFAPVAVEQVQEQSIDEDVADSQSEMIQVLPIVNNVVEKVVEPRDDKTVEKEVEEQDEEMRRIQRVEKIDKPRRIFEEEIKPPMDPLPVGPRKGAIATSMDTESVRDAYNDIRDDNSDTKWAVFKYDATRIICSAKGISFEEFKQQFDDNERAYGYIRLQTGDEMSKRHKFLFVTWIGPGVNVIKRAKMSIDKAIIKHVVSNFAVELQLETLSEFDLPFFIDSLNKASGANYGTGIRDI